MDLDSMEGVQAHVGAWLQRLVNPDLDFSFTDPANPKFIGLRDAVTLIPDGAVVGCTALGSNQQSGLVYMAIRRVFEETGHPRNLTVIVTGGCGGRGKLPGTIDDLGVEGLVTRFFSGHLETFRAIKSLAAEGKLELQCIPQGTFSHLVHALAQGQDSVVNTIGVGTFMDPRVGRGTPVNGAHYPQYVALEENQFRYSCPKFDVAIFNLPAADRAGNLYSRGSSMVGEAQDLVRAARNNGGITIANVGLLVEPGYGDIFIPAEDVDHIIYHPDTTQSATFTHENNFPAFTLESQEDTDVALGRVRRINDMLGITPMRCQADDVLARLAATIFAEHAHPGDSVDIGVGLPEVVSRLLYESGLMAQLTMINESGVFGGVAAPGIFFGASVNPDEIVPSSEAFRRIYKRLDSVILGVLQADSDGNVNVSKRGEGPNNYVGPGGFIDLTQSARQVYFCSSWMAKGSILFENGRAHIEKAGALKFTDKVDEITFSGKEAVKRGQEVFYISHVGAFRLTPRGMEMTHIMPGIDVRKDILDAIPMKLHIADSLQVVSPEIISGVNFTLEFAKRSPRA
ncbi:MAG: hypothetical protein HYV27_07930 [Candidatus Hydrogenedentes bacterium]|nr:hypothetical protein [Candidatus Hydrogenedentota bacterium]